MWGQVTTFSILGRQYISSTAPIYLAKGWR